MNTDRSQTVSKMLMLSMKAREKALQPRELTSQ